MGAKSRAKGKRGEREVVALARAAGLEAVRTWATAQSPSAADRACDVRVGAYRCQVKRRRAGYGSVYAALADVDIAFVRCDGAEWLGVVRAARLFELLRESERCRRTTPAREPAEDAR